MVKDLRFVFSDNTDSDFRYIYLVDKKGNIIIQQPILSKEKKF